MSNNYMYNIYNLKIMYKENSLSLPLILEVFMGFVKSYIQLFAHGSVTTEEWKNYLFTYFKDKVRNNALCTTYTCIILVCKMPNKAQ